MSKVRSVPRDFRYVAVHAPLLIAVQAAYALVYVHSDRLQSAIVLPLAFRMIVWTLPVVLYLAFVRHDCLGTLGLRQPALRGILWSIGLGCAIAALTLLAAFLRSGHAGFNLQIGLNQWINGVLLVGASEEVVYRGFYLPLFAEHLPFWQANLLQASLFLAIHVPGLLLLRRFSPAASASVFALAIVLGWLRRRTDSLWGCAILHSINNFASFVIH